MNIVLYDTKSDNNVINKILENPLQFDIQFKEECSIYKPVIYLASKIPITSNYCYIESFKRYYFVNTIEIKPNNIYKLELEVDVLESFKTDILNSKCSIVKQKEFNPYYDSNYESEVRKECKLYYSDKEIQYKDEIIMVTIGG